MKQKIILKNKLQLIYDSNNAVHTASISLWFRVGSIYEKIAQKGITHLTEHMFFRRLFDLTQKNLYFSTERLGAYLRGRTFTDAVCFDISCPTKNFREAFNIVSKILYKFEWSNEEVEAEKRVVKKQIDFKHFSLEEVRDSKYFKGTKNSEPIMGTDSTVEEITAEDINSWKHKFFNCDNCCIVLTGNFSDSDLEYVIKKANLIDNVGITAKPIQSIPKNCFNRTEKDDVIFSSLDSFSDISIFFDIDLNKFSINDAEIIMNMLAKGDGGRLPYLLKDKLAITDFVDSWLNLYNGFARLSVICSVDNQDILMCLSEIFSEIINFRHSVNHNELLSTIPFFTDNLFSIRDNPQDLNFSYGLFDFIIGMDYDIEKKNNYNKCLSESLLRDTAKGILTARNMTVMLDNNSRIIKRSAVKELIVNNRKILL